MHHIVAPTAIAYRLQQLQVADDIAADGGVSVVDVAESRVRVCGAIVAGVFGELFFLAALRLGGGEDFGSFVREGLVAAADRIGAPGGFGEVGPAQEAVAVVDHDVGDGFDAVGE